MDGTLSRGILLLPAILLAVTLSAMPAAGDGSGPIGSKTVNFSLPSQQGTLVSYGDRYYGRHNLVMTFFPAAFTPV